MRAINTSRNPMQLPASKTGIYVSADGTQLEYWFVFQGRKAIIGGCHITATPDQKKQWEDGIHAGMRKLLIDKFGAKPIILGHG